VVVDHLPSGGIIPFGGEHGEPQGVHPPRRRHVGAAVPVAVEPWHSTVVVHRVVLDLVDVADPVAPHGLVTGLFLRTTGIVPSLFPLNVDVALPAFRNHARRQRATEEF
jgi:hypothetical protein